MLPTNPEQRTSGPAPAAAERQTCPLYSLNETSGPSASVKWSAGSGLGQSASGIATRSKSLGNMEKARRREVPGGHALERDDARRGERVRRRRPTRKVGAAAEAG